MRTPRSSPLRGLLAGLVALVAFGSCAVAITAGGSSGATTPTPSAQTIVASVDGRARATEGRDGGDGRSAAVRVADEADSHDTLTADAGDHHR
jgi:hypothetical protein